jgi:F-type H+-transporting ATPase subunit b
MKRLPFGKMMYGLLFAALLMTPVVHGVAQDAGKPPAAESSAGAAAKAPESEKQEKDENEAFRNSPSVRAMGAKLGMSAPQAAMTFDILNFAVLALLVGWFLIRTLPKTFRSRNTSIQKDLVDARTATEEASARLGSVEARLGKLDEQIATMRAQAEKDSALDEQRIKASVEEEKQKILADAEQEIAAATLHAHRQLQQYAAELAIEQAGRKLVINAETDRLLIQNFARRLSDDKGGQN